MSFYNGIIFGKNIGIIDSFGSVPPSQMQAATSLLTIFRPIFDKKWNKAILLRKKAIHRPEKNIQNIYSI